MNWYFFFKYRLRINIQAGKVLQKRNLGHGVDVQKNGGQGLSGRLLALLALLRVNKLQHDGNQVR